MHLLESAASGWGKSYLAHALIERNIKNRKYDRVVVLDYSDEYRGLCSKKHGPGLASHWFVGEREHAYFGVAEWTQMIEANEALVLARHGLNNAEWQEVATDVILACRQSAHDVLIAIDEGHKVAPERKSFPDEIEDLATAGRVEGGAATSSMWMTQRPAQMSKTIIGNCTARFLGGYESSNDLDAIKGVLEYPKEAHTSGGKRVPNLPESLYTEEGEPLSVRKWIDDDERVVDSEWIYSDDVGKVARRRSSWYSPECEHVGAEGKRIDVGI
jgi:hypothetical protein